MAFLHPNPKGVWKALEPLSSFKAQRTALSRPDKGSELH